MIVYFIITYDVIIPYALQKKISLMLKSNISKKDEKVIIILALKPSRNCYEYCEVWISIFTNGNG